MSHICKMIQQTETQETRKQRTNEGQLAHHLSTVIVARKMGFAQPLYQPSLDALEGAGVDINKLGREYKR